MYSIVQLKSQIRNLITMIINKDRKNINKWKHEEGWYTMPDNYEENINYVGYGKYFDIISVVDTFFHLFDFIQYQGGDNIFMQYINIIDNSSVNSDVKWKSIKKKNEFFNTFLMA